jgi:DNA adenine methylase
MRSRDLPATNNLSLVRWAGSKRAILPDLLSAVPGRFNAYYEPFCGSACLFLALAPRRAVLSDINAELIGAYRTIRSSAQRVHQLVTELDTSSSAYYKIRNWQPRRLPPLVRAARFVYLNHTCFNGLYRTNRRGEFNVPFGNRTGHVPSLNRFEAFARLARRAKLACSDFQAITLEAQPGDFVYLDPPYFSRRPTYGEYGYNTFREHDILRLVDTIRLLDKRGVFVLLSYGGSADLRDRIPFLSAVEVRTRRHIAAKARHRRDESDWLLTNYACTLHE